MKKLLYSLILVAALLISFSACKKEYLDTVPTDQVSSESVFTTTTNAMQALNGIHRIMYTQHLSNQHCSGEGAMNIARDMMGEDVVHTGVNGYFLSIYQWLNHRGETNQLDYYPWYLYYRFISNANMIISNINKATGPASERNSIRGEAYVYRAWSHFQLVQLFGARYDKANIPNSQLGVPIMLTNNFDGQARNTVEEVYTQIIMDLDSAIANLATYTRPNASHFNLRVAQGIRARVALTMQDWTTAATMAVAARTGFNLMTTTEYKAGFNNYTNQEWMWGSTVIADQTTYFYSFFAFMSRNYNSTSIRTNPRAINSLLYNSTAFTATDVRKANFDVTGLHTALALPSNYSKAPYTNQKFLSISTSDSRGDVVYMRAAEMYLIEAEAYARLGQDGPAQTALNTLRQKRETVPANYVASTKTGQALIDEIMLNRRLELWGEGFRFTDLKRLDLPVNRNGANHSISLCLVMDVVKPSDLDNGKLWQWLIPKDELNANSIKMVQNPL